MTYLQYHEISLGEGDSVDLEQDVVRASEERSIAIRAIARAFTCRWRGFLHSSAGYSVSRHTLADDLTNR